MKTSLTFLICIFSMFVLGLNAQNVEFNDLNFKQALLDNELINTNGDEEIQISEAESYTGDLIVGDLGISDLTGIEHFQAITFLDCGGNQLTELDVSKNIGLKKLYCFFNKLTTLELGNNEALNFVLCDGNDFENVYIQHSYLDTFILRHNNIANPTIEIAEDNSIIYFDLNDNLLNFFDPFNLSKVKTLRCDVNNLAYLDLAGNLELQELDCKMNPLLKIKLNNNSKLKKLNVEATSLTDIDLSNNQVLETFNAGYTVFPTIDLSKNPLLERVDLYYSKVESVNLKNGNNAAIDFFSAKLNEVLSCVQVDDSLYSVTNWLQVEETLEFRESCPQFVETSTISTNFYELSTVFPNPANGSFKISFSAVPMDVKLEIYNQQGQSVFQEKYRHQSSIFMDLALVEGLYIIKIEADDLTEYKRLVIQN